MHVLVDVVFYGRLNADGKNADDYSRVMDRLDRKLLALMPDFPAIVDMLNSAKPTDVYPATTDEDLENERAACLGLVEKASKVLDDLPDPEEYPLWKLLALADPIVDYLEACFCPRMNGST